MNRLCIAVMALCVSTATAQTKGPTKVPTCDPLSALLNAPTVFGVGRPTIVKACPAFEKGVQNWAKAMGDSLRHMSGEQAIQLMLHGSPSVIVPPKDTTPVIVPVDSTPKPPADTTTPPCVGCELLPNVNPMGPLMGASVAVPKGWAGRSKIDLQPGGGCVGPSACVTGEGAVRILTNLAFMAFEDPIVFFGQPGKSHLHQFFGNTHVNAFTTSDSLVTNCSSTSSGGAANCTAYWTPAMVDASGQVVRPVDYPNGTTIYYKSGYQMDPKAITPLPTGLKMIAGDKTWTNTKQNQEHVWWLCADGAGPSFSSVIPDCVGRVELIVIFPQCWDGKNLDSPDHKSHMSYPIYSNNTNGSKCPADHPVVVPEITELFFWQVPTGVHSSTWHISSDMDLTKPGGLSAHADWMMGWDKAVMAQLVACLNASKDVGTNGLCNGTYLNPPPL